MSSAIQEILYDAKTKVLTVRFIKGHNYVYEYDNVPPRVAKAFINAPSEGQFYNRYIKGRY